MESSRYMLQWQKNTFMILALWSFICLTGTVALEEDFLESEEYYLEEEQNPLKIVEVSATSQQHDSVFKWAWEVPSYRETYEHLENRLWIEPNIAGEAAISYVRKRDEGNADSDLFVGYAAFRPFFFDFGGVSFAVGTSFIGGYSYSESANDAVNEGGVLITLDDVSSHLTQFAINLSTLISFPQQSFQIVFDAGYAESRIRANIDPIRADAGIFVAEFDEYQYEQKDQGIFFLISFIKYFDRSFLNVISLSFVGGFRLETNKRKSTALLNSNLAGDSGKKLLNPDVPFIDAAGVPFADPQAADEFDINLFSVLVSARLFTIPIENPFLPGSGLSFNIHGEVGHFTGEILGVDFYGTSSKIGTSMGLFEAVSFRVNYTIESGNDLENAWEFEVSVGLYGILREVASALTAVPGT